MVLCLLAGTWCVGAVETNAVTRPRIGVVFGGGGALGIAHIGVLRVLEEQRVPVDCIAGTSMGAIIAGLYASGMSPDEIERALAQTDWWDALKDRTPRRELTLRRKEEEQRYLFDFELGLKGFKVVMPTGMSSGQKLENILRTLTLHASSVTDFDALNIPFRAVATDLETGEAVVLDRGNLAKAMRASMAVPGIFSPVHMRGRLLADGGIVNNVPVDVARAMGADVVIAVNVENEIPPKREGLLSFIGVLGRSYAIMSQDRDNRQLMDADIVIEPNLESIQLSHFHRVEEIVPRGEKTARQHADDLAAYAVSREEFDAIILRQRLKSWAPPRVSAIRVRGNETVHEDAIRSRVYTEVGATFDAGRVDRDVRRIYGIGEFETASFDLGEETPSGRELIYNVEEKPWGPGYLRFGLKLETDFDSERSWSLLVNYSRRRLTRYNAEWRTELQAGRTQRLFTEWYQPLFFDEALFIAPGIDILSENRDVYDHDNKIAEYDSELYLGQCFLGSQLGTLGEVRAGIIAGHGTGEVDTGEPTLPEADEQLGLLAGRLTLDRLDSAVFPRKGFRFEANAFLSRRGLGADEQYNKLHLHHQHYLSADRHTLIAALEAGTSFGSELPVYDEFGAGGIGSFAGLAPDQLHGRYLGIVNLAYRCRLARLSPVMGRGAYLYAGGSTGNAWQDEADISTSDLRWGGVLGFGVDTLFGPALLGLSWADQGNVQAYLAIGSVF